MITREVFGRLTQILTCECGWERMAPNMLAADRFERQHAKTHEKEE